MQSRNKIKSMTSEICTVTLIEQGNTLFKGASKFHIGGFQEKRFSLKE